MKKDDIPLPQLPKLPSSMGEMWEMAGELGKSATSLISGVQQSEVPAKPESKEVMSSAKQTTLLPPNEIIEKAHSSSQCHCPVGSCLGRHEPHK